jgi:DNA-binding NarL/FixJ family response regulator
VSKALRVFLVEDSPVVRERLIEFVEEPGEVDVVGFAETESDAVRALEHTPVDVAVVDLNLKEGTGLGVLDSIHNSDASCRPTVVVLTNYAFPEFELACLQRGADYFLDKSTQTCDLKRVLVSLRAKAH